MPQAKSYAEKAIEINPDLAGAYTSLGWVYVNYEYDWAAADSSFRKSIQLNPNYATANHWFGLYLSNIGKHNEAIASVKKAAELDPQSMIIQSSLGQVHIIAGRHDEASKYVDRAHQMSPTFSTAIWFKYAKLKQKNTGGDVTSLLELIKQFPNQPMHRKTLLEVYLKMGNREAALDQMVDLLESFDGILNDCHFADIFFLLGKTEEGYRRLEKGIEARETWAATYGSLPSLKKFQQEPRFRELYKKIGHPLYVD